MPLRGHPAEQNLEFLHLLASRRSRRSSGLLSLWPLTPTVQGIEQFLYLGHAASPVRVGSREIVRAPNRLDFVLLVVPLGGLPQGSGQGVQTVLRHAFLLPLAQKLHSLLDAACN